MQKLTWMIKKEFLITDYQVFAVAVRTRSE